MFIVSQRIKQCRCWQKPHHCTTLSNRVLTCTPGFGTNIDEVCCKKTKSKVKEERREGHITVKKNRYRLISQRTGQAIWLKWLRKRTGQWYEYE